MSTAVRFCCRAAFLILVLCLITLEIAAADEVDPPDRVARLSYTDGEVSVAPAGTDTFAEAVLNRPLTSGDRVWVEDQGRAELQVGTALIHLDEKTGFSFLELDDDHMQMSLPEGVATVHVFTRGDNETLEVETPNGRVALLHPGEYTIEVNPEDDETLVKVRQGSAEVQANNQSHVIDKGEALSLRGAEPVDVSRERLASRSRFEDWSEDRAREREESPSSRYVSSGVIGYQDLDREGDWLYEREYGYVWMPRYVAVDWAPYRYGRWVWIAPWGYTWIDDARWGFAPFHYGRWAHVRNRWCWVPGPRHARPVYSPALVAWTGQAGTAVGWFPLGPRDVYVPGYRHSPRYIRRVNEGNSRFIHYRDLRAVDSRNGFHPQYRYAREPHAVTIVDRDRFLGGRPLRNAFVSVAQNVNHIRPQPRPPALTPYRESVLGGSARSNVHNLRDADRQRELFPRYRTPARIPFDAERRAIEANGGQPPSRTELRTDGPKRGDDFRGRAWREQTRERVQSSGNTVLHTAESTPPPALHEMGSIRQPPPPGQRSWSTQRPNRDIEVRRDDSSRAHPAARTWSSNMGDVRERAQRDRGGSVRMSEPSRNVGRTAPTRMERAPAAQAPQRSASPPRGDRGGNVLRSSPQRAQHTR